MLDIERKQFIYNWKKIRVKTFDENTFRYLFQFLPRKTSEQLFL